MNQAIVTTDPDLYVEVYGTPIPQGRLSFYNGHGVHSNAKRLLAWRRLVGAAARSAMLAVGQHTPIDAPVAVDLTVSIAKPRAAGRRGDTWPTHDPRNGDIDHHARAILDALVHAHAIADDRLVVDLSATKVWADEGVDSLEVAGAIVRVWRLG